MTETVRTKTAVGLSPDMAPSLRAKLEGERSDVKMDYACDKLTTQEAKGEDEGQEGDDRREQEQEYHRESEDDGEEEADDEMEASGKDTRTEAREAREVEGNFPPVDSDQLLKDLEVSSDEGGREQGNDVRRDAGVNEGAVMEPSTPHWSALQYAAYMTGMHYYVKEKHRVESYLAQELQRAEDEMRNTKGGAPRKRVTLDGDIEMYTVEQQRKRRANIKSPGFVFAVDMMWYATQAQMRCREVGVGTGVPPTSSRGKADDGDEARLNVNGRNGVIDKGAFVSLMVKVHYLIISPPIDREMAVKNAQDDWVNDNRTGGPGMTHERFVESMFELVDIWTETSAAEEYDELSMVIAGGVTTTGEQCLKSIVSGQLIAQGNVGPKGNGAANGEVIEEVTFCPGAAIDKEMGCHTNGRPTWKEEAGRSSENGTDPRRGTGGRATVEIGSRTDRTTGAGMDTEAYERETASDAAEICFRAKCAEDALIRNLRLRHDADIVYDPTITKEPVFMSDLKVGDASGDAGDDDSKATMLGRSWAQREGGEGYGEGDTKAERSQGVTVEAGGRLASDAHEPRMAHTGLETLLGRRSMRKAMRKRHGGNARPGSNEKEGAVDDGLGDRDSKTGAVVSKGRPVRSLVLLSAERVNAVIAKIYVSKMQVDTKLLKRDGHLCWVDKCRRKRDQRMDRFVLQYHIRQFGTMKLARRNLHQLCRSIMRLALHNPRIATFARLIGVPTMTQKNPYREQWHEFRPFCCSDFVIPVLTRLCPEGENMDRWLGNAKMPTAVTVSDFMQAVREVCPHVPLECPAMVSFMIQVGRLAEEFDERCRKDRLNKPYTGRPSLDVDDGLLIAMAVWSAEEENLIMLVTLKAIAVLRRWMRRWQQTQAGTQKKRHEREVSEAANGHSQSSNGHSNDGGHKASGGKEQVHPTKRKKRPSSMSRVSPAGSTSLQYNKSRVGRKEAPSNNVGGDRAVEHDTGTTDGVSAGSKRSDSHVMLHGSISAQELAPRTQTTSAVASTDRLEDEPKECHEKHEYIEEEEQQSPRGKQRFVEAKQLDDMVARREANH